MRASSEAEASCCSASSISARSRAASAACTIAASPNRIPIERSIAAITPDEPTAYMLTSGSTSLPKAVIQTQRMLASNLAQGMQAAFEKKYGKNPAWANTDGLKQLGDKRLQDYALDYVSRRNVVIVQPATWCAAGRADIAAGTRIGKLLIAQ